MKSIALLKQMTYLNRNGLYTTVLRGVQNGKPVEEFRQITSVAGCINPYSEYDAFIAQAENPARDKPLAAWLAVQLRAVNQADHKR